MVKLEELRIVVAGDSTWENINSIQEELGLYKKWDVLIIKGNSNDMDILIDKVAFRLKYRVQHVDIKQDKKNAEIVRNIEMLNLKPDLTIIFHYNIKTNPILNGLYKGSVSRGIKTMNIKF